MKSLIQQIKEGGSIDLSLPENKGWVELLRIASLAPNSLCCDYPVHLNSEGIICTYCGEPCEIKEKSNE